MSYMLQIRIPQRDILSKNGTHCMSLYIARNLMRQSLKEHRQWLEMGISKQLSKSPSILQFQAVKKEIKLYSLYNHLMQLNSKSFRGLSRFLWRELLRPLLLLEPVRSRAETTSNHCMSQIPKFSILANLDQYNQFKASLEKIITKK